MSIVPYSFDPLLVSFIDEACSVEMTKTPLSLSFAYGSGWNIQFLTKSIDFDKLIGCICIVYDPVSANRTSVLTILCTLFTHPRLFNKDLIPASWVLNWIDRLLLCVTISLLIVRHKKRKISGTLDIPGFQRS